MLARLINYGTAGYPDNVARRLRVFNVTILAAAFGPACFAVLRLADPARSVLDARGQWKC
jgi:hypothetical protein